MSNIIGVNRRGMPAQLLDRIDYKVVLVGGHVGDYAAYVGQGEDERVAEHGSKLSFKEACIHFPVGLKEENYRE